MRSPDQLVHSRARLRRRYALFPIEGYPTSRLPLWNGAEVRILTSPAMGAGFVQYKIDLTAGGGTQQASDGRTEAFVYLLSGDITITVDGQQSNLSAGGFAFVPHTAAFEIKASGPASLLLLRKTYEATVGVGQPKAIVGHERDVKPEPFAGNEHARLQLLIPDDLQYDLAMNIFTFDPGHGLPYVETHVMEHGLYFLAGKGMYYLDGEWMEVEQTDFIWMAPFCPQSFYATGPSPSKYIYYKNVNREIAL
ncbi:MAG TPA: (S)-ureidoglycine aminohydrolase [Tepidisphaeraceae bacterium]|jgi:(S)-ureidoglycine aminohydrolase|nr:(S)-ureidoglycine aminohydrolase [Tepidisphaeraceae bacterium]